MKKTTLLCALTLFAAVAASGCGSSAIQSIDGDTSDIGTPVAVSPSPTTGSDETITPTEPTGDTATTDPVDTGTTTTPPPDDTGNGSGYGLQCFLDDQGVKHCMIVDPGPGYGGGDVKPGLIDHLPTREAVLEDPTTPPSDTGGGGGSDGSHVDNCPSDPTIISARMIAPGSQYSGQNGLRGLQGCKAL